MLHNQVEILNG